MEHYLAEVFKRNSRQTFLITLGIVLMSISVNKYIGLERTILFSVGIGLVVGLYETFFIKYQQQQRRKVMGTLFKKNLLIYIVLFIGMILTVTAFVGVFDLVTILMFGLGFGLVITSLETIRRKSKN